MLRLLSTDGRIPVAEVTFSSLVASKTALLYWRHWYSVLTLTAMLLRQPRAQQNPASSSYFQAFVTQRSIGSVD